jgi:hypothetical protein
MIVKCDSKTCVNYENGMCGAESIEIKNFEFWVEEEKEFNDIERCGSYEKDPQWLCK